MKNKLDKKYKYISCLIPVLAITFILVFLLKVGINNTIALLGIGIVGLAGAEVRRSRKRVKAA